MMKCSMSKIEPHDANDGPVVSEGGHGPSTLSTGHGGAGQGALTPGQRWSVGRKREVVLRLLLRSERFRTMSVLIDRKRIASLSSLLEQAPPDAPLYAASQGVLDAIAGFHLPRGILALGQAAAPAAPADLLAALPARGLVLALVGIANHDNMGGLMRNAAAFGADLVLIDGECCDPLYRKAIRVSVGASLILPGRTAANAARSKAKASKTGDPP